MSGNLFSKGTNSAGSSKGPSSSKPKQPKNKNSIEEEIPVRISNNRPTQPTPNNVTYPCQLCPKVYPSIHALRGHQNAHRRDRLLLLPGIQLVVDLRGFQGENHVEPNPPAPRHGGDAPNGQPRYRALRMRAENHHSEPRARPRPRARSRSRARARPQPPNRNQGNQRYVAPRRAVSNFPPPPTPTPPPSRPTFNVTLVPTQVKIKNEGVPETTHRQPPPPPPPPPPPAVVEPKVEIIEEVVPAQPSIPQNFGNLQFEDDGNPDGLDLELRL